MNIRTNKKLLLVVPYRNRSEHLKQFLPYIHTKLKQQNIFVYKILIVEQMDDQLFNRGLLCNIGFLNHSEQYDYVCFHDIDMICNTIDYSYNDHPTSLIRYRTKSKKVYKEYFGGITIFPNNIFKLINGFSNDYWGWGCEDDDLYNRCIKSKIDVMYREGSCIDLELTTNDENKLKNPNYNINLKKLIQFKRSNNDLYLTKDGLSTSGKYYNTVNTTENLDHTLLQIKTMHLYV